MQSNPYSSPQAEVSGTPQGPSSGEVSPTVIAHLEGTKRWVRIVGVFMWIGTGFMVLAGLGMVVAAMAGVGADDRFGAVGALGLGFMYVLMAALYVVPAQRLWAYGTRIGQCVVTRSTRDLEAALDAQRGFWKFVGVSFLVLVVFYAVAAVVAIGAGIFMATSGG